MAKRNRGASKRERDPSNYEYSCDNGLPSSSSPCEAPDGYAWIRAYSPADQGDVRPELIGKWLIRVRCGFADNCWQAVRKGTDARTLGIAAKVSTDWGNEHDFANYNGSHVICVYTGDYSNKDDVLRVARGLALVDAVRKQVLHYKPDLMTYGGIYEGSSGGEVAIYACRPPYTQLEERKAALEVLAHLGRAAPKDRAKRRGLSNSQRSNL